MTRYRCVDSQKADGFPVAAACRAAGVSTSAYYEWCRQRDAGPTQAQRIEAELLGEIRSVHADSGATYGSPRVHAELRRRGHAVNHKRFERLMRAHDLVGANPRKRVRTTVPASRLSQHPILSIGISPRACRISVGPETSPTSLPVKAGCSWRPSSTSARVGCWAMPWPTTCAPTWSSTAWMPR